MHEVEWSGTLFYSTEGELGEDDFRITAEELFLQDIGSSAYTEYDPANPDFIKFLMANPRILELKQGHIHSHNKMGVFFSGTDSAELVDNSEFHNYYVSLIVNNRNEMVAKVAFRATETRETKTSVKYRGNDGTYRTKEVTGTAEGSCVYTYDCDIQKLDEVGESFGSRFLELKSSTEEKVKKMAKEAKKVSEGFKGTNRRFDNNEWDQGALFDDVKSSSKGKKEERSKDRSNHNLSNGRKGFKDADDWIDTDYTPPRINALAGRRVDPGIYSFLVKLLNLDFLSEASLGSTIEMLNRKFVDPTDSYPAQDMNTYCDQLDSAAISHYINVYPEDLHVEGYNTTIERAIDIIELFENQYPELTTNIVEALTFAMDEYDTVKKR